jgi:hypothetical protein
MALPIGSPEPLIQTPTGVSIKTLSEEVPIDGNRKGVGGGDRVVGCFLPEYWVDRNGEPGSPHQGSPVRG